MDTNFLFLILVGCLMAGASGFLGSFMVLKRMSLVGDALSHVALPGIAIAIMVGISPMFGAFVALVLATLGVWYLGEHTEIYSEALVGVFFTAGLAMGILITPEPELFEALFGDIDKVTKFDGVVVIIASIFVFIVAKMISRKLVLGVVSEDLAKVQGINISRLNLVYLLLVGVVVSVGVKFLGTLLTGALVIIPAAAAKNISRGMGEFQIISAFAGVMAAFFGILASNFFNVPSGPAVVLVSVLIFVMSLPFKR